MFDVCPRYYELTNGIDKMNFMVNTRSLTRFYDILHSCEPWRMCKAFFNKITKNII